MDFSPLSTYLNELAETVPGYDCILRRGRETLFRQSHGCRADGMYWFYSATKLFTCTAALRLLERGRLDLEDPVSRYLPEYASLQVREKDGSLRPARTTLLIRHLFTMCGGLTYDILSPQIRDAKDRSTRGILRAAADMPLAFDPGESYLYSLCHDVLAGVAEAITGLRFADYVLLPGSSPVLSPNTNGGARASLFSPSPATITSAFPTSTIPAAPACAARRKPIFSCPRRWPAADRGGKDTPC